MYDRLLDISSDTSNFLFGPRGTGKTSWVKSKYPNSLYFDLLDSEIFKQFLARPGRLAGSIPEGFDGFVILDEVQRVPELLNEVHRLIENRNIKFVLTGSSARKLRRGGHNLLAGRALLNFMHPLVAKEMGNDFSLEHALMRGMLPRAQKEDFEKYLQSYVRVYLDQEIQQEGLVRKLDDFARFLEVASLSQGQLVNMNNIARESQVGRLAVIGYFRILQELLIGYFVQPFTKRAKRRLVSHPKFYFFDPGVYRVIRPMGTYDTGHEVGGVALETLIFQQLYSMNDLSKWRYKIYYFRTATGVEVDFVLYGERGVVGIEVKLSDHFNESMIRGLKNFSRDYPEAKLYLLYTGKHKMYLDNVTVIPVSEFLMEMEKWV